MTKIRATTEADIDAVADLHVRGWQAAYKGILPADFLSALNPAEWAQRRRSTPREPGQQAIVAERDDRIVAMATFGPYRHDGDGSRMGELYSIYVDPDHLGEGIGTVLITAAKEGLAAAGFPDMRLWVLEENHRARRFYERHGLRPDGTTQTWTPRNTTLQVPELRYAVDL